VQRGGRITAWIVCEDATLGISLLLYNATRQVPGGFKFVSDKE
jgi:hypothetical protein